MHMDLDEEDPKNKVSNRVKLLIKNMFENKESGWVKTKQETKELLKKGDIENQFIAAEEKKAAEQRGRDYDDRRFGNRDRDDKRDKGGQYMKKQASTTSDNKGGRDGKKRFNEDRNSKSGQYKPKGFERGGDKVEKIQLKPIDDLELGDPISLEIYNTKFGAFVDARFAGVRAPVIVDTGASMVHLQPGVFAEMVNTGVEDRGACDTKVPIPCLVHRR